MLPATRTPEGWDGHCVVCGNDVVIEPSPAGDATCPVCGSLTWLKKPHANDGSELTNKWIRRIFRHINEACEQKLVEHDFWHQVLAILTQSLAAHGGAVWRINGDESECLSFFANAADLTPADRQVSGHVQSMLPAVARTGPQLVSPRSMLPDWPQTLLLFAQVQGSAFDGMRLVGVSQRCESPAAVNRGYLLFVKEVCEVISRKRVVFQASLASQSPDWPPKPPKPTKLEADDETWLGRSPVGRWIANACKWLVAR